MSLSVATDDVAFADHDRSIEYGAPGLLDHAEYDRGPLERETIEKIAEGR